MMMMVVLMLVRMMAVLIVLWSKRAAGPWSRQVGATGLCVHNRHHSTPGAICPSARKAMQCTVQGLSNYCIALHCTIALLHLCFALQCTVQGSSNYWNTIQYNAQCKDHPTIALHCTIALSALHYNTWCKDHPTIGNSSQYNAQCIAHWSGSPTSTYSWGTSGLHTISVM